MKAPVKPKARISGKPWALKPQDQRKADKSIVGKAPSKEGRGRGYANMPYYKGLAPTSKPRPGKNT